MLKDGYPVMLFKIEQNDRKPDCLGCLHKWVDDHRLVETKKRVTTAKNIIERSAISQPKMRQSTPGNRRRDEISNAICRMLFAVIGNQRGSIVVITEVEPRTAILLNVQIIDL